MLVPYYTAQCATGFKSKPTHNLNLNLNRLPNSSFIDGQILNLPVENQIGIEISHCMFQLIVFNEFECRFYFPNQSTSFKMCEDFLELLDLLQCIKSFVEHFPKSVVLLMGLRNRIKDQIQNAHQERELTRKALAGFRDLAKNSSASIIYFRFFSHHRKTWGSQMSLPLHPIQHFRNAILTVKLTSNL